MPFQVPLIIYEENVVGKYHNYYVTTIFVLTLEGNRKNYVV